METAGVDCDLHEALLMSNLRDGDRLVLFPRWTVDERLPVAERKEFTPTPKQMLYGQRAELMRIVATEKDASGRVTGGVRRGRVEGISWRRLPPSRSSSRRSTAPWRTASSTRSIPAPTTGTATGAARSSNGLCDGQPNVLYDRLVTPPPARRRGRLAGPGGVPGRAGRLPPGRAAARLRGQQAGVHRRPRPDAGAAGPGAARHRQKLSHRLRRLRPAPGGDAGGATVPGLPVVQDPRRHRRSVEERAGGPGEAAGTPGRPTRSCSPSTSTPASSTCRSTGWPRTTRRRMASIHLVKDAEKEKDEDYNADVIQEHQWAVVAITPGGIYGMLKQKWPKYIFGHELCDLLVLDEASQMNLPEAIMAALPLKADAPLIVVGDHRQMPPIVKHDWDREARRTFRQYQVYESLFDTLRAQNPPMIQFAESFRLHAAMAEFLRQEVYRHDGIAYHSKKRDVLPAHPVEDDLVAAVLRPDYPAGGGRPRRGRQPGAEPVRAGADRADPAGAWRTRRSTGWTPRTGWGSWCRTGRSGRRFSSRSRNCASSTPTSGLPVRSAIDTVERFQGGERTVILVSATESDRAYLLASSKFLLDPRRLTVALSRAKRKMILVASRSIFSLFSPDEETFANSLLWKNLLLRTCSTLLWEGERGGKQVAVWGGKQ